MNKSSDTGEKEYTPKHEHVFKISRALFTNGWVNALDLECTSCDMRIYAQGKLAWQGGYLQRMLHVDDLERITPPATE